jgi:hypothetical protein
MSAQGGGDRIRVRIDTTAERAIEFVNDLMNDDKIRAEYEADPAAVLKRYGVHVTGNLPPVKAPPKTALRLVRSELRTASGDMIRRWLSFGCFRRQAARR